MSSLGTDTQQTASTAETVCADCGALRYGPFCSQCGEQAVDRHSLTLSHFLKHNVLHELSHVDGKIFRTFRYLVFRPGFLSAEYFAGRRRRYINPVRLLLTCLLVLALLGRTGSMTMSLGKLRLNLLPPGPPFGGHNRRDHLQAGRFWNSESFAGEGVAIQRPEKAGRCREVQSRTENVRHRAIFLQCAPALRASGYCLPQAQVALRGAPGVQPSSGIFCAFVQHTTDAIVLDSRFADQGLCSKNRGGDTRVPALVDRGDLSVQSSSSLLPA